MQCDEKHECNDHKDGSHHDGDAKENSDNLAYLIARQLLCRLAAPPKYITVFGGFHR